MTDTAKLRAAEGLLLNATEISNQLRHLADNEINSDSFAVVTENYNSREIEFERPITDLAIDAAGVIDELIAALEAKNKHIAELEAAPVAPIAEGETAVMPDYPGTALTQRECYQLGLEAGKAETQTASQWRPANKCEVCVEGARGGCSTCAFNRQ